MPELPEVEVISRGLRPYLIKRKIVSLWYSGKPLRVPVPLGVISREMVGREITAITRRAKYIQIGLDSGSMLIIHLGMTGNMGIFSSDSERAKHDHLEWLLDDGSVLRLNDTRRFGAVLFLPAGDVADREQTIFRTTGPEPFDDHFSPAYLHQLARNKTISVKQFIMTNGVVAGIGNIYANESLFRAGIRPMRKVKSLSKKSWARLITSIRTVLEEAIDCGGSTISDFLNASQQSGYFQMNFTVYGRAGEQCRKCLSPISKTTIGGRASYYCASCQR